MKAGGLLPHHFSFQNSAFGLRFFHRFGKARSAGDAGRPSPPALDLYRVLRGSSLDRLSFFVPLLLIFAFRLH
jgi:hypothetical protein